MQRDPTNRALQQYELEIYHRFKKSSYLAEIYLQQRSKAVWIKLGDDNTQYFYSVIKHRKLKHSITQLKDRAEEWQNKPNDIARIFVEYYEDLLEKRDDSRTRVNNRVLQEGTILTIDQQMELLQPYTDKDVKKALFNIDRNKSFGPDGYGSGFFRDAWDIIGTYFTEAVLKFYQNGQLLKQINSTNIALIPKIEVPECASHFRPISCCNVIYKCISK